MGRFSVQVPASFQCEENQISILIYAVLGKSWASKPISNLTNKPHRYHTFLSTHKYFCNNFKIRYMSQYVLTCKLQILLLCTVCHPHCRAQNFMAGAIRKHKPSSILQKRCFRTEKHVLQLWSPQTFCRWMPHRPGTMGCMAYYIQQNPLIQSISWLILWSQALISRCVMWAGRRVEVFMLPGSEESNIEHSCVILYEDLILKRSHAKLH